MIRFLDTREIFWYNINKYRGKGGFLAMAKISFTKLGLTKNQEVKILSWNGQDIEVKQYLSISDKLDIITNVINNAHDGSQNFSNPVQVNVYTALEILYAYTNINFTEKQKEDTVKLYDLVKSSGLLAEVINIIPKSDYDEVIKGINDSINSIYAYQNSVLGILDSIKSDYSSLDFDASAIQEKLADPQNMELLKGILAQLG